MPGIKAVAGNFTIIQKKSKNQRIFLTNISE